MIFETHTLKPVLDSYIESIFHFKDFVPDHSIERVVPTGHIFIIFELDGIIRSTLDNKTLKPKATFSKVWISGVHRNYISISAHSMSEMFVIQFKPFGAHPFLHLPIKDLNEKILSAEEVLGIEIIHLREQILAEATSKSKFEKAENWLESRFKKSKTPPDVLLTFFEKLQNASDSKYHQLADNYPSSQKHLIDQFKKYIGLTPKYMQRIFRFNEILQMIHKKEKISWARIAYQCGFSDQSSFIKEFKHFSSFNPQEFIKQEFDQDETNFFPLDSKG